MSSALALVAVVIQMEKPSPVSDCPMGRLRGNRRGGFEPYPRSLPRRVAPLRAPDARRRSCGKHLARLTLRSMSREFVEDVLRQVEHWRTATPSAAPSAPITYEVRTPRLYWGVVGALALISLGMLVFILPAMTPRPSHQASDLLFTALTLFGIAMPVLYVALTREYRAKGAIRLSLERLEIPDEGGHPLVFIPRETTIAVRPVVVHYLAFGLTVHKGSRGYVLELSGPGLRRRISTMTLVDGARVPALLADLELIQRGLPPRGLDPTPPGPPDSPRDDYDDKLDQELARLD